jgi:hypothetical protein
MLGSHYLQLFVSYFRYLFLLAHSGVQHILCCVSVFILFVLCTLYCQFHWIVHTIESDQSLGTNRGKKTSTSKVHSILSFGIWIFHNGHPDCDNDLRIFEAITSTYEQRSLVWVAFASAAEICLEHITSSCLCLISVICFCLRIVVFNTYCVVFLFSFYSSCIRCIASFTELSIVVKCLNTSLTYKLCNTNSIRESVWYITIKVWNIHLLTIHRRLEYNDIAVI